MCGLSAAQQSAIPPPRPKPPGFRKNVRLLGEKHYRRGVDTKGSKAERPGAADSGKDRALSIRTDLVVLEAWVLDRTGRAVSGLAMEDFEVFEDRISQEVVSFNTPVESQEPLSIILVLDKSGSVYEYFEESLRGADHLVESLGEREELALVTDDIKLLCDYTSDKAKLWEKLRKFRAGAADPRGEIKWETMGGASKQFYSLTNALLQLCDEERSRIVVIVESDGDEILLMRDRPCGYPKALLDNAEDFGGFGGINALFMKKEELLRVVRWSPAAIYSLITQVRLTGLTEAEAERRLEEQYRQGRYRGNSEGKIHKKVSEDLKYHNGIGCVIKGNELMEQVAEISGGWATYLNQPEKAEDLIDRILAEARQRYSISYYPTNTALDGAFRRVRIRVKNHPEYIVRAREGYYALAR